MGVQILNKDVSLISSIANVAKAQISNVGGIVGWAGGGDVTPNPTPNWANIGYDDNNALSTVAVQQIQGINTTISLEVTITANAIFAKFYKIDNSAPAWTNGGTVSGFTGWTTIGSFPLTFNVTNNQYVSFGCYSYGDETATVTVKNNSDGAVTLDTFTATITGNPL